MTSEIVYSPNNEFYVSQNFINLYYNINRKKL